MFNILSDGSVVLKAIYLACIDLSCAVLDDTNFTDASIHARNGGGRRVEENKRVSRHW